MADEVAEAPEHEVLSQGEATVDPEPAEAVAAEPEPAEAVAAEPAEEEQS